MKAKSILFIWLLATIISCVQENKFDDYDKRINAFYAGPHELRKMVNYKATEGGVSGGFFLFLGAVQGNLQTPLKITFSWKTHDGDYITTSMDIESIKVRFNENREKPVVFFKNRIYHFISTDNPLEVNQCIRWATIECKESDWKEEISLPLDNVNY